MSATASASVAVGGGQHCTLHGKGGLCSEQRHFGVFVFTLKCELVHRRRVSTRQAARSAVFEYLEAFYNRRRLHSSLGYVSPERYEGLRTGEVTVP